MSIVNEVIADLKKNREALLQNPALLRELTTWVTSLNATATRRKLMNRRRADNAANGA